MQPNQTGLEQTLLAQVRAACAQVGLDGTVARPVRLHSNGVFVLPGADIVVRVGGGADAVARAERAVAITRWLGGHRFPTVEPVDVAQPVVLDTAPDGPAVVTFWWQLHVDAAPAEAADLGRLLRRLHELPTSPVTLPTIRPLARLVAAVGESSWLAPTDRGWVLERAEQLQAAFEAESYPLGVAGLVHGDAQLANLIRVGDGRVVLADWDSVAVAPREWDLIPMTVEERFGGAPGLAVEFAEAYGFDVTTWPRWTVLRDVYELRSVAAHIRRAPISPPHAAEATHRIGSLRANDRRIRWHPVG